MPLFAQIGDPMLRETARDFAANRRFRRDLFVRGSVELSPDERRRLLSGLSFAAAVPRNRMVFTIPGPIGELTLRPELHGAVMDVLERKNASFDELLALPAFGAGGAARLLDCLALLVHSGHVLVLVGRRGGYAARAAFQSHDRRARAGRAGSTATLRRRSPARAFRSTSSACWRWRRCSTARPRIRAPPHGTACRSSPRPVDDRSRTTGPSMTTARRSRISPERMTPLLEEQMPVWRRLGVL